MTRARVHSQDASALSTAHVAAAIESEWGLTGCEVGELNGGMNSQTWFVHRGAQRWVAKAVPIATQPGFAGGLAVARIVDAAGIPAGAPEPTVDGRIVVDLGERQLGLLRFVDGTPLTGVDAAERHLIGTTLGRVHTALNASDIARAERFDWVDVGAPHLGLEPWIRPAVKMAVADVESLPISSLTHGLLHTDPEPEAFRLDERGRCGLIDWDRALVGPFLYDVASAVMYVGGPERASALLDAYVAAGAVSWAEIDRALTPMLRFRWAVQADYFARRIATNDMTGIATPDENQTGLEHASRGLGAPRPD
jgi:Ser/Thr protein kinase RdoA (MazF antagonist)